MYQNFEIIIGGNDWGMALSCETFNQALEVAKALQFYYKHEKTEIEYLEINQKGTILEKII
jgi:hypothetical protein